MLPVGQAEEAWGEFLLRAVEKLRPAAHFPLGIPSLVAPFPPAYSREALCLQW